MSGVVWGGGVVGWGRVGGRGWVGGWLCVVGGVGGGGGGWGGVWGGGGRGKGRPAGAGKEGQVDILYPEWLELLFQEVDGDEGGE